MVSFRKTVSHVSICVLSYCIAPQLLSVFLWVLPQSWQDTLPQNPIFYIIWIAACSVVSLGALLLCRRLLFGAQIVRAVPAVAPASLRTLFRSLVVCFAAAHILNYITDLLLQLTRMVTGYAATNVLSLVSQTESPLVLVFQLVVFPCIFEELAFRKALYPCLAPLGDKWYVLLSASAFALAHMNLYQLPYAFFIGGVFAILYLNTGRIGYCILLHGIFNTMSAIFPLCFSKEGMGDLALVLLLFLSIALSAVWFAREGKGALRMPLPRSDAREGQHILRECFCNPGAAFLLLFAAGLTVYTNFLIA